MPTKDYVKRGRIPPRIPQKKETASRHTLWRIIVIVVILVIGFSYGLYKLNNTPVPPVPEVILDTPPVETPRTSELPPPPVETWDYVESLPNREVEVVAKEQVVSTVPYIMQCGAYKTSEQAQNRKVAIAFQGMKSKINKKEGNDWYSVVLGPYKSKRDAQRDKSKLQRAKIEPCEIWKQSQ